MGFLSHWYGPDFSESVHPFLYSYIAGKGSTIKATKSPLNNYATTHLVGYLTSVSDFDLAPDPDPFGALPPIRYINL